ncbi:MAG: amidase family protein [Burkholderiaceae bacterium]|nr:amidase family protein [Burkholderiaceae bacterium]
MNDRRFPFHAPIPALLRAFHGGEDSPRALLERCFAAIDAHGDVVNALPTRVDRDTARAAADAIGERIARGDAVGPLAGLPYCAKDTHATAGLRTTWGSPIFADHIPTANDPVVQRVLDADALLIAKSNTPEFAAGAQTFNPVFGATRHPFDPSLTVGGSTGGGAAALACGMTVVADGSDLGGSLRNPASFCGVVGMRPSSTAEPALRNAPNVFGTLNQIGALGARVADLRIAHRAIRTPAARRPLAEWLDDWECETRQRAERASRPLRLAWSIDCGGSMPVAAAVRAAIERAIERLCECGVELVEAWPDLSGADDCFQVLRAEHFVENWAELYQTDRARLKDTVAWNIEQGLALDVARLAAATRVRSAIFERVARFVAGVDAWLLPTAQVLPFPIDVAYPTEIDGEPLRTYIDWVASCYRITVSGHPALTLPAGFASRIPGGTPLPVGLQLVGGFDADEALLDVGERVEQLLAPLNAARPALYAR